MPPDADTLTPPKEKERRERKQQPIHLPPYHVVLLDDNDHTYEYVIEMLGKIFGYHPIKALKMACEVDLRGRVIVDTTTKERAELKRDQIHAYGPDWRIEHCRCSMTACIEPADA